MIEIKLTNNYGKSVSVDAIPNFSKVPVDDLNAFLDALLSIFENNPNEK